MSQVAETSVDAEIIEDGPPDSATVSEAAASPSGAGDAGGDEALLGRPIEVQPSTTRRPPDRAFHWTLLCMCLTAVIASVTMKVQNGATVVVPVIGYTLPELCVWKRVVGFGCPGCGLTRCFISMGHGDLAAAFAYNPTGILLFLVAVGQIPFRAVQLRRIARGQSELEVRWLGPLFVALPILLIGQWLVRILLGSNV